MRLLLASTCVALAWTGVAWGHGEAEHTGFQARVSVIEPFLPGLVVTVLEGHVKLSVTNLTERRVVILDEAGRPQVELSPGETEVWTEPRIGSEDEPPAEEGLVKNWAIAGTADGQPFEIRGFLGYRPPAGEAATSSNDGLPAWAIVLAGAAGALVLGAALALPLLRRSG